VATVNESGTVKAISDGMATITAKTNMAGKTATCEITVPKVQKPVLTNVKHSKSKIIAKYEDTKLTAEMAEDASVTVQILNSKGRVVKTVIKEKTYKKGNLNIAIPFSELAQGEYKIKLTSKNIAGTVTKTTGTIKSVHKKPKFSSVKYPQVCGDGFFLCYLNYENYGLKGKCYLSVYKGSKKVYSGNCSLSGTKGNYEYCEFHNSYRAFTEWGAKYKVKLYIKTSAGKSKTITKTFKYNR
jgi:hypothetical protein